MMGRITLVAAGCALIVIVAGVAGSRSLMVLVAGPEFADAASALALLVAAEAVLWASFHFNPFILATVGQLPLLKANLTIAVATVITALALSYMLGQVGGGLAVLFGSICTYISLTLIARSQSFKRPEFYAMKAD
jgi:O-antigen/teichoic acid export membrane protein